MKRTTILAVALTAVTAPAFAGDRSLTMLPDVDLTPSATMSQAAAEYFSETQYSDGKTMGISGSKFYEEDVVTRGGFSADSVKTLPSSNRDDTLGVTY
ncbi:hypothetical protein ACP2AV_06480 [Aliiroseovarius sp. PTFE2010]|uniref:hypothetical protein n=1 Tax=Aliiroseovarius sp. PTFE2010 TaxID=3417190 RepID=UPI003CF58D86